MPLNRRSVLKLGAAGLAAATVDVAARPRDTGGAAPVRADRPLDLLILGGTGLTGPHQVRYALARGHRVTIFNRGRKQPEWPGDVEQLLGDRDRNDYASLRAEVAAGRRWDVCIDKPSSVPSSGCSTAAGCTAGAAACTGAAPIRV